MKVVTVVWVEPKFREAVGTAPPVALDKSEILDTEVLIAATGSTAFTSLAKVKPDQTNTITKDLADGNYTLRFIVTDTLGQKGKPLDFPFVVKTVVPKAPPGVVTGVTVTMTP